MNTFRTISLCAAVVSLVPLAGVPPAAGISAAWASAAEFGPSATGAATAAALALPMAPIGAFVPQQGADAAPPPAPLSDEHRAWLEEDVVYIISPREEEVFGLLASAEERDLFIETFWRVRDLTPGTLTNETREEHDRRVTYANRQLGRETPRQGWQTDRGRIYIQLGEPRTVDRQYDPKGFWPMELWSYDSNPRASGLPPFIYVLFFRPEMNGEYTIYDPFVDGPGRLAKSITMQMADPREIVRALVQGIGYEIAHAALSLNRSERPDFAGGRPSPGNEILLASIGESPFVGLDTRYTEVYLTNRGNVEASVMFGSMPVDVAAMAFWDERGLSYLHYAVQIAPEHVMLAELDNDYYLSLGVEAQVSDLRGNSVESAGDLLEEHFGPQRAQALIRAPLAYYDRVAVVPGVYDFNVEVLNRVNDEGALARARLSVAPVQPDGAVLSDLLVAGAAQPVDLPVQRAFQFEGNQYVPAINGRVNTGGPMYLFAQLIAGESAPDAAEPVTVTGALIDAEGNEVDVVTGAPIPPRPTPAPTPLVVPISLEGVRPGPYTVRLSAELSGNRTLSREKEIEVVVPGTVLDPMVLLAAEEPRSLPSEYQMRGGQYLRKGETAAAIAYFRAGLEQQPDSIGLRRSLAQTLIDAGDPAEAARVISPLAQSAAASSNDALVLSIALRQAGEPTGAVQTARVLLTRWAPTAAAHNALGDALLALGQSTEAAQAFRDSLALDPEQPEVREKLARISGGLSQ